MFSATLLASALIGDAAAGVDVKIASTAAVVTTVALRGPVRTGRRSNLSGGSSCQCLLLRLPPYAAYGSSFGAYSYFDLKKAE